MIFFPTLSEFVMTRIWCISKLSIADMRLICIVINSAFNGETLFVCTLRQAVTLLSFHMYITAVADPNALTLPSKMTAVSLNDFCVFSKARLNFDE